MLRCLLIVPLSVCGVVALLADDSEKERRGPVAGKAIGTLALQLAESPDDRVVFDKYLLEMQREIRGLIGSDLDGAIEKLSEMKTLIVTLTPQEHVGRQLVEQAGRLIQSLELQIEIHRVSLSHLVERLRQDPDDTATISLYRSKLVKGVLPELNTNPSELVRVLREAEELISSLQPDSEDGKQHLAAVDRTIKAHKERVDLQRMTLGELVGRLKGMPGDARWISMYHAKLNMSVRSLARCEPKKAETLLDAAKKLSAAYEVEEGNEEAKTAIMQLESCFEQLEKRIRVGKRLLSLIGTDAVPLNVDGWVNGETLADNDLTGKVVLLDFWAVWCGPCVLTFPHLRDWHEEYSDRGLVIIGVTQYYGYNWDDHVGRAVRGRGENEVSPEQERAALARFAEHYCLPYRLAVTEDRALVEHYAVTGIPHVVIIDRKGKVRLVQVGAEDKALHRISETLELLLSGKHVTSRDSASTSSSSVAN